MGIFVTRLVAILLLVIGLTVALGGIWLITLGGSFYYVPGGVAVALAGFWLWRGKALSGWVYGGFLLLTLLWALWEVGMDGWQLTARLVGPALFGLLFALPALRRHIGKSGWFAAGAGLTALAFIVVAALQSPMEVAAGKIPQRSQVAAPGEAGEWAAWGRDAAGTRFSPLDTITPENVGELELAWEFDTGLDPMSLSTPSPLQATPIMVDERLYLCDQNHVVYALDPDTGKQVWRYDPKVDPAGATAVRTCRGVAYHDRAAATLGATAAANGAKSDGNKPTATARTAAASDRARPLCERRIISANYGAELVALDSATGQLCPGFGNGGIVDLKDGLGDTFPGVYYVSSAPTIVNGTIVLGGWVMDNVSADNPSGVVRGFDVETGALKWAWDAGNPDNAKGPAEGGEYTRATPNSWAPMSGDAELGLVYVPTGNPAPDYFGGLRSEASEKFGSAIVALDAGTGELRWSFQTAHHDLWDYDVASQPTLFEFPGPGGPVPAVAQPTKRGELFILDRRTGTPLTEVTERAVAQKGGVPEDRLSPTQPFSTGMPSFAGGRLTETDMWGLTPIDQLWCRIQFHKLRYDGPATPPGLDEAIIWPSIGGGMNWGGVAYDPERKLMLVNSLHYATIIKLVPRAETDRLIAAASKAGTSHDIALAAAPLPMEGTPYGAKIRGFTTPLNTLCHAPPYGRIAAVDMTTGKLLWQRPVGTIADSGPLGISLGLPIRMGMPGFGGTLVTRSGLTFYGALKERTFRAFATDSGKELWSARMPAAGMANPMTYVGPKSGRQFVVIAAGGHVTSQAMPLGSTFRAYALPEKTP